MFAGCQYAGKRWERLSKQAETLADNVVSLFSSFFCLCNYKPVRCATPLSNLLNCVFMQMSLTVEERLDRIEQLLRGQKNVLNFSEACDFTGISPSYMYKLTHNARIPPLQAPRQECLLPARGARTVAAAKSRADRRTEGSRGDRIRPSQTASEIAARIGPTGPKPIGAAGLSTLKKAHRSP